MSKESVGRVYRKGDYEKHIAENVQECDAFVEMRHHITFVHRKKRAFILLTYCIERKEERKVVF